MDTVYSSVIHFPMDIYQPIDKRMDSWGIIIKTYLTPGTCVRLYYDLILSRVWFNKQRQSSSRKGYNLHLFPQLQTSFEGEKEVYT